MERRIGPWAARVIRHASLLCLYIVPGPGRSAWAADSLRCGSRLVALGDSKVKVLDVCGEPLAREVLGSRTLHQGTRGFFLETTEVVEKWTYDAGRTHFRRELTFSGGTLVEIEFGDKP